MPIDAFIDGRNGTILGVNNVHGSDEGETNPTHAAMHEMFVRIIAEVEVFGTTGLVIINHEKEVHRFTIVPEDPARG